MIMFRSSVFLATLGGDRYGRVVLRSSAIVPKL